MHENNAQSGFSNLTFMFKRNQVDFDAFKSTNYHHIAVNAVLFCILHILGQKLQPCCTIKKGTNVLSLLLLCVS